jgi:antirestriction protein ArdC
MKRDLYADVTARILSELEKGALPWVKPWRSTPGMNHPHNAGTGRPYSGCNVILLWIAADQGWPTPRFLTFKQALDLGGHVRKGEHGTKVYFVKRMNVRDTTVSETDEESTRSFTMMREFTVFNVAQCDELPEKILKPATKPPINPDERDATIDEFLQASGADLREGHGEAYYRPSDDYVSLPAFGAFKNADHFYATAFHELGHWTGHKSRLDRDLKNRFGDRQYAAEELIAELCAAFICAEFGLNNELRHAGYIDHWIALLKHDNRAFMTAASKAQAAADHLRNRVLAESQAEAA